MINFFCNLLATRRTLNPFYGIFSNFEGIKLVHRHLNYAYSEFLSILNAYRLSIFIRIFLGNPFYMITHNFIYVFRLFPKVLAFTCLLQKHSSCLFNKSHVPRNGKKNVTDSYLGCPSETTSSDS